MSPFVCLKRWPTSFLLLVLFFSVSCRNEFAQLPRAEVLYHPVYKAIIEFATNENVRPAVIYWPKNNQELTDSVFLLQKSKNHQVELLGLLPEQDYEYQIFWEAGSNTYSSEVFSFQTDTLPAAVPDFTVVVGKTGEFNGYIFLRKKENPGVQLLLNSAGKVIWYQLGDSALFRPFCMSGRNRFIALRTGAEILECNFYGDTLLYLKKDKDGYRATLHHEIIRDSDKRILALTKEYKTYDFTKFGGEEKDSVAGDGIILLDNEGNPVWHWSVFDQVSPEPSRRLYLKRRDWSHANALSRDHDGHFLISFRNFNQIWKVHNQTGQIIWKLGAGGDFTLSDNELFSAQHAVHTAYDGSVLFFDNSMNPKIKGRRKKRSRALAFQIDETGRKVTKTLDVILPDSLYSFKQGSVYYLDDKDRLLFCSSMAKKIVITDLSGQILWQVNTNEPYSRAYYLPVLPWQEER